MPDEATHGGAVRAPSVPPARRGEGARADRDLRCSGAGPLRILLDAGVVTLDQLEWARDQQPAGSSGADVLHTLVHAGEIDEIQMLQALAAECKLAFMRLGPSEVDPDAFGVLSPSEARALQAVPLRFDGDTVVVATSDPVNVFLPDTLKERIGRSVRMIVSPWDDLRRTIEQMGPGRGAEPRCVFDGASDTDDVEVVRHEVQEVPDLETLASESPVVRYVNYLIASAIREGASDIHVEPDEEDLRIRYRVDGVLFEQPAPPAGRHLAIISRLKIMADLDISERRLPQDGRIRVAVAGRRVDLRISTFPISHGEKAVIRILDDRMTAVGLDRLGMAPETSEIFLDGVHRPNGMVLVTGPTGSGKSTTLYAALRTLDRREMNVCTVEDPIEYELPDVNQTHIRSDIGFTFAAALRSLLRQDPDAVMVGEIRDEETARTAVRAALTGHLVLSTLHTTDAPSAVVRLVDIGVPPYLVAASLSAVLAQRLARRVCEHCKEPVGDPAPSVAEFLENHGVQTGTLYRGAGCDRCRHTGYTGRIGLYELLVMDDRLRHEVDRETSPTAFRQLARDTGLHSLAEDGLQKAVAGLTTAEEVMRVTAT